MFSVTDRLVTRRPPQGPGVTREWIYALGYMENIRSGAGLTITLLAGAVSGLVAATHAWDRMFPPPRCAPLPDTVHPMICISTGLPPWLTVLGIAIGVLIGIATYRLLRSRRARANAWVVAHPSMYAVVLGGVLGTFHLALNTLLSRATSLATLILWVIVFPTIMTSIARARTRRS